MRGTRRTRRAAGLAALLAGLLGAVPVLAEGETACAPPQRRLCDRVGTDVERIVACLRPERAVQACDQASRGEGITLVAVTERAPGR